MRHRLVEPCSELRVFTSGFPSCGRPGSEMPHFDKYAYEGDDCYGLAAGKLSKNMPPDPHSTPLTRRASPVRNDLDFLGILACVNLDAELSGLRWELAETQQPLQTRTSTYSETPAATPSQAALDQPL